MSTGSVRFERVRRLASAPLVIDHRRVGDRGRLTVGTSGEDLPMHNVVITGASSGIGAATALALDRQGARVFAGVEHAGDGVQALATASSRLVRLTLDVASDASIADAFTRIERDLDGAGLDGVVNNAGVGFPGPLEALPRDDLRRLLEINVLGQVAVTQAALPLLRRGERADRLRRLDRWRPGVAVRRLLPRVEVRAGSDRRRLAPRARPRRHPRDPDRAEHDLHPDLGQGDRLPRRAHRL